MMEGFLKRQADIIGLQTGRRALALLLEQAANMTDSQYRQIAVDSKKELETYLKPLSLYARAYGNALIAHGK